MADLSFNTNSYNQNPDYLALSEEEKTRLIAVMERMLAMGIAAVYGDEDESEADAVVDSQSRLILCKAICCTFRFALTKDEVKKGLICHDTERPFFIAREQDGYCPHLNRQTLKCTVWTDRPLRCRRYDCSKD